MAKLRVVITIVVFCLGLPSIFVILSTTGQTSSGIFAYFIGRPGIYVDFWGAVEFVCVAGIPALLLFIPQRLHSKQRPWRDDSSVPAWLAGFAAVLTVVYVLTLHFDNLGLADWHLGFLSVAAFGAAALLAPFYRIVANACWKSGVGSVFDPVLWWSAWLAAYHEMRGVTGDSRVPADPAVSQPEAPSGAS